MPQVLLGQLRRGVVNQQEHSAFFCLLVARKHYFCAKIKPNFLGERRECGLAQPAEGRPESGRSQSVPLRPVLPVSPCLEERWRSSPQSDRAICFEGCFARGNTEHSQVQAQNTPQSIL